MTDVQGRYKVRWFVGNWWVFSPSEYPVAYSKTWQGAMNWALHYVNRRARRLRHG